jgi:hypothetical protein
MNEMKIDSIDIIVKKTLLTNEKSFGFNIQLLLKIDLTPSYLFD